jgi:DNA-binding transcriptional MocR family regulator
MTIGTADERAIGQPPGRSERIPLYLQVADRLERWIESEGLGPGVALPPEARLQERFGVSRVTVRSAMTLLAWSWVAIRWAGPRSIFGRDLSLAGRPGSWASPRGPRR